MPGELDATVQDLLANARSQKRDVLLEPEGLEILHALGIRVPSYRFVGSAEEARRVALASQRLMLKVVSRDVLHKSDVGGVEAVPNDSEALVTAVSAMQERFAHQQVEGYLLSELIEHDRALGGELLLGMRWTEDFGPVATLGPGGVYTELLADGQSSARDLAIVSPQLTPAEGTAAYLASKRLVRVATGRLRGQPPRISAAALQGLLDRLLGFAARYMPSEIGELEINPLALTEEGPVALDVLIRLGRPPQTPAPPRPLAKLSHLLTPRSIAVMGVSERLNPGHIILNNILREGFDRQHIFVVKPGREEIEGCRCFPDLESIPQRVDLLILSIDAAQVPGVLEQTLRRRLAESLIVIPGGLGERPGSEGLEAEMAGSLAMARSSDWQGPVVNGGNCLGIRSKPGRYDTLFIPEHKLPVSQGEVSAVALISQSGAFAVARASRLWQLNPRYLVSVGNQTDLTVGDYLSYLAQDRSVQVFACYVEGFRPLDGVRWLEAAQAITASGRAVVLYRAGRTAAGARATASHTASIAGDYAVTLELARQAGVVVAESLTDFDDLVRLFSQLRHKRVGGWRLGAVSNAGFECVAMADSLGPFALATWTDPTRRQLDALLQRHRLGNIVGVNNPLDVTPIMSDAAFSEAATAVLDDANVDVGIIGCVPLTGALQTLPRSGLHAEQLDAEGSIAAHLAQLWGHSPKAWIAVVDAGPLYDPLARHLEAVGVPTFRSADRALRLFALLCRSRLNAL